MATRCSPVSPVQPARVPGVLERVLRKWTMCGAHVSDRLWLCDLQYGMECLFRFYSYGLEKSFSADLYRDFEDTTLKVWGRRTSHLHVSSDCNLMSK